MDFFWHFLFHVFLQYAFEVGDKVERERKLFCDIGEADFIFSVFVILLWKDGFLRNMFLASFYVFFVGRFSTTEMKATSTEVAGIHDVTLLCSA